MVGSILQQIFGFISMFSQCKREKAELEAQVRLQIKHIEELEQQVSKYEELKMMKDEDEIINFGAGTISI